MKQCKLIALLLLFLLGLSSVGHAEEPTSVYDAIENSKGKGTDQPLQQDKPALEEGTSISIFPFLVKMVVSLIFIIVLIFLVLKFWAGKTKGIHARGPFLALGGCPLGTNRSIQAVMIGKTIYLLGVGENVQLIREITEGDEYQLILDSFEEQVASPSLFGTIDWFSREKKEPETSWENQLQATLEEWEQDQLKQGKKREDWDS